jgi:hypothetical protein
MILGCRAAMRNSRDHDGRLSEDLFKIDVVAIREIKVLRTVIGVRESFPQNASRSPSRGLSPG